MVIFGQRNISNVVGGGGPTISTPPVALDRQLFDNVASFVDRARELEPTRLEPTRLEPKMATDRRCIYSFCLSAPTWS